MDNGRGSWWHGVFAEGDLTFDVPVSATTLVLSIDNREDRGELPVVLK